MNINLDVENIVRDEVKKQSKQVISSYLSGEVNRVFSKQKMKEEIIDYVEERLLSDLSLDSIVQHLDMKKIHEAIIGKVSYAVAKKLDCEEYL